MGKYDQALETASLLDAMATSEAGVEYIESLEAKRNYLHDQAERADLTDSYRLSLMSQANGIKQALDLLRVSSSIANNKEAYMEK